MTNSHNPFQLLVLKHPRMSGLIMFLIGAALTYWMIILPILQSETGAPNVRISVKGTMVGVLFIIFGLTYLAFGSRFARLFQPSGNQSKTPAYLLGSAIAIIGAVIYFALKTFLESRGYIFHLFSNA